MNKLIKYLLVALVFQANMVIAETSNDVPKNREDWRAILNLARKAYQEKDYQKSILFYETVLPVLPDEIDLSEEIAQTLYRLKKYEEASKIYERKSKSDKQAVSRTLHNLGNIAMEKKQYQAAIDFYKNSLRNNPSNSKTRYNLSEAIRRLKEEEKKNPPPKKDDEDKKQKPKEKNDDQDSENPTALNDPSIQRELENLIKKEVATKRKLATGKEGKGGIKTQKDW